VQVAFAQPDGGIEGSETAEAQLQRRHGRTWTDHAIFVLKNLV
jgi:hypothetical protein